jgi:hypothetical protein
MSTLPSHPVGGAEPHEVAVVLLLHATIQRAILDAAERIAKDEDVLPTTTEAVAEVEAQWVEFAERRRMPEGFIDALRDVIHRVGHTLNRQLVAELN